MGDRVSAMVVPRCLTLVALFAALSLMAMEGRSEEVSELGESTVLYQEDVGGGQLEGLLGEAKEVSDAEQCKCDTEEKEPKGLLLFEVGEDVDMSDYEDADEMMGKDDNKEDEDDEEGEKNKKDDEAEESQEDKDANKKEEKAQAATKDAERDAARKKRESENAMQDENQKQTKLEQQLVEAKGIENGKKKDVQKAKASLAQLVKELPAARDQRSADDIVHKIRMQKTQTEEDEKTLRKAEMAVAAIEVKLSYVNKVKKAEEALSAATKAHVKNEV